MNIFAIHTMCNDLEFDTRNKDVQYCSVDFDVNLGSCIVRLELAYRQEGDEDQTRLSYKLRDTDLDDIRAEVGETRPPSIIVDDFIVESFNKAHAEVEAMLSGEQREHQQFLKLLAKTMDKGKSIGIDTNMMNPLQDMMVALSENIITDQR